MHPLAVPASAAGAIAKLESQPIEQLRMARRRSLYSEIVLGLDQAAAKKLLPVAVYGDARRQRVVSRDNPAGEVEPVRLRCRSMNRRQDSRHSANYIGSAVEKIAPLVHE